MIYYCPDQDIFVKPWKSSAWGINYETCFVPHECTFFYNDEIEEYIELELEDADGRYEETEVTCHPLVINAAVYMPSNYRYLEQILEFFENTNYIIKKGCPDVQYSASKR